MRTRNEKTDLRACRIGDRGGGRFHSSDLFGWPAFFEIHLSGNFMELPKRDCLGLCHRLDLRLGVSRQRIFFSLLSASMDARNWRVMLVVTLLTFLIVVPITPVVILLIVNVMFNEPITPIMVKVMGIGAPVYIVVLCLVYLWFPWRQNFRLLVNGWGRWRVGLFGVLSCSYMGFLTWLGMFLYLGIMKQ